MDRPGLVNGLLGLGAVGQADVDQAVAFRDRGAFTGATTTAAAAGGGLLLLAGGSGGVGTLEQVLETLFTRNLLRRFGLVLGKLGFRGWDKHVQTLGWRQRGLVIRRHGAGRR